MTVAPSVAAKYCAPAFQTGRVCDSGPPWMSTITGVRTVALTPAGRYTKAGIVRPSNDLKCTSCGSASCAGSSAPSSDIVQRVTAPPARSHAQTSPALVAADRSNASRRSSGENAMLPTTPRGNSGCGSARRVRKSVTTMRE
jgi:hypothetical protein